MARKKISALEGAVAGAGIGCLDAASMLVFGVPILAVLIGVFATGIRDTNWVAVGVCILLAVVWLVIKRLVRFALISRDTISKRTCTNIGSRASSHTLSPRSVSASALAEDPKGGVPCEPELGAVTTVASKAPSAMSQRAQDGVSPFRFLDGSIRPSGGHKLFAYTEAWLTVAGLLEGRVISRTQASKVAGATAIAYHLKGGRFVLLGEGLALSPAGKDFFLARQIQGHRCHAPRCETAAWINYFRTGRVPN